MQGERRDEVRGLTATTIAGSFALAAFAVAIIAGLASGNAAWSVLLRAFMAMVFCYPIGLAIGFVAQRLVSDHLATRMHANPLPEFSDEDHGAQERNDRFDPDDANDASDEEVLVV